MARKAPNFDQVLLPFAHLESPWKIPTELPDLSLETEVALDTETCDISLQRDMGPGFFRYEPTNYNEGFICGISAAWRDQSIYIPLLHNRKEYFSREVVGRWIKSLARQRQTNFVFQNFQY